MTAVSVAQIQENYEYYDYDDTTTQNEERRVTRSAIEWFDVRTRSRRDVNNEQIADDTVTYEVCVMLVEHGLLFFFFFLYIIY